MQRTGRTGSPRRPCWLKVNTLLIAHERRKRLNLDVSRRPEGRSTQGCLVPRHAEEVVIRSRNLMSLLGIDVPLQFFTSLTFFSCSLLMYFLCTFRSSGISTASICYYEKSSMVFSAVLTLQSPVKLRIVVDLRKFNCGWPIMYCFTRKRIARPTCLST